MMSPESTPNTFRAGAAVSDITPPLGASLDGPISKPGPATFIHDRLSARCLALSDGTTTLAIAVCDCTMIEDSIFFAAKERVRELTGIPLENLMMTATHSHSTPRGLGISLKPIDRAYREFLSERIADGICQAIKQLSPARLGIAVFSKPEHLFNRRWFMKSGSVPPNVFGATGEQVCMNPPRGSDDLLRPAGPTDPQVAVVSVQHADGTPLALLANYGLHYVGGAGPGHVSADYYGVFCRYLEEQLGTSLQMPPFVALLSNGASGNVNNIDFSKRPPSPRPPYEKMVEVARDLGDAVLGAIENLVCHETPQLISQVCELELALRKPDSERLGWARKVLASDATPLPGFPSHRWEKVFAVETVALADYPDSTRIPLQVFGVGDFALCAVPAEVFAETGLQIRTNSPFPVTAVMSLANGYHGYLPPPEQHALGGYETWPARSSCLEVDAATKIRCAVADLLSSAQAKMKP